MEIVFGSSRSPCCPSSFSVSTPVRAISAVSLIALIALLVCLIPTTITHGYRRVATFLSAPA